MEAQTVFPNSVNAPSQTFVKDRLHRIDRIEQISKHLSETVQATTRYSEFVYTYKNGEVMNSIIRVKSQMLDVFA
tara:strand:+ start:148 stop:372 length:225 start_codon:yes stop_codon:yes gene_type:complete